MQLMEFDYSLLIKVTHTIIEIFLLTSIGFLCAKMKWLNNDFSHMVNEYLLSNILLPATILKYVSQTDFKHLISFDSLVVIPIFIILHIIVGFFLGYIAIKLFGSPINQTNIFLLSCTFGNHGSLPLSILLTLLIQMDLEQEQINLALSYWSVYYAIRASIFWTVGLYISFRDPEPNENNNLVSNTYYPLIKNLLISLINPVIIALILGVILSAGENLTNDLLLNHDAIFRFIWNAIVILDEMSMPLLLITLGISLTNQSIENSWNWKQISSVVAIRLLLCPIIGLLMIVLTRSYIPQLIEPSNLLLQLNLFLQMITPPVITMIIVVQWQKLPDSSISSMMFWSYILCLPFILLFVFIYLNYFYH